MNAQTLSNGILRAVGILSGILILLYFLYEIRSVLAYLSLAAVVALIGRPVVLFLRRRLKFPNTLAVVATMVLMIGVLAGIIALFFPLITEQAANLSLLNIEDLRNKFITLYQEITSTLVPHQNNLMILSKARHLKRIFSRDSISALSQIFSTPL